MHFCLSLTEAIQDKKAFTTPSYNLIPILKVYSETLALG